jgi:CubicO group peptidase (beta-lactamase class C family)
MALAQTPSPPPQTRAATERAYLDKLGHIIEKRFSNRSVGYAIVANLPSGAFVAQAGGDARRAPDPSPRPFSVDDKIAIASISKVMTATAILQLLARNKLSVDAPVWPYLPSTWKLGVGVKDITFRGLLSHRAGNRCPHWHYAEIKQCFAGAILDADKAEQKYNNSNYGVLGYALARLDGMPVATIRDLEDREQRGDPSPMVTVLLAHYVSYVNAHVFKPLGFPTMYCKVTDTLPALGYMSANAADAYDFSKVGPGQSWTDQTSHCPSGGWFLSARQLATVIHALNNTSKILPPETVALMKAENLGLFANDFNGGLKAHSHGGFFPAEAYKGELLSTIIAFNNGVTAGMLVNSKFKGNQIYLEMAQAVREAGPAPE